MQVWAILSLCGLIAAGSLEVDVTANWGNAPFPIQLVEAAAGHNESLYIPVMKSLLLEKEEDLSDWDENGNDLEEEDENDAEDSPQSDRDIYEKVVAKLSLTESGFTNLNLVNKIYSPRIEAHFAHFRNDVGPELAAKAEKSCATDSFGEPLDYPLGTWVKYGLRIYCSESDLYALQLTKETEDIHAFDRVIGTEGPVMVLYGDPNCSRFSGVFSTLLQFAESGKLRFVWRYIPVAGSKKTSMSGYGIALKGKTKEQKAISDGKPSSDIAKLLAHVKSKGTKPVEIPDERLHELSLKIAAFVLQATESKQFGLLKDILHNLPQYASHILSLRAPLNFLDVKSSAARNEKLGAGPESVGIFINGAATHKLETDLPTLIEKLEREVALINEMKSYGFDEEQAKLIFSKFALLSAYKESEFKNGASENRFAVYRDAHIPSDESSGGVVFFNDLETDDSYNLYSRNRKQVYLKEASQLRTGQVPPLRENVHDIIFALNFGNKNQLKVFFMLTKVILDRGLAQQVGILPVVGDQKDTLLADMFYRVMEMGESKEALALLYKYYDAKSEDEQALFDMVELPEDKIGLYQHYNRTLNKFSITDASVIINGVIHNMRSTNWQTAMGNQITHDVRFLQQKISSGWDEGHALKDLLYENAKDFRNTKVIPLDPANIRYKKISPEMLERARTFKTAHSAGPSGTFWLIGDFNSENIRSQFIELLKFMRGYKARALQVKVLHTTSDTKLLDQLFKKFGKAALVPTQIDQIIATIEDTPRDEKKIVQADKEITALLERNHIQVHLSSMLFNSRYLRLSTIFEPKDLELLLNYEFSQRIGIFDEITDAYPDKFLWKSIMQLKPQSTLSDLDWFDLVTSTITNSFFLDDSILLSDVSRFDFSSLNFGNAIDLTVHDAKNPIDILAIIDPLDEISQRLLSIVSSLIHLPFVNAKILLLPIEGKDGSYKLDRFYTDSFTSAKPTFDSKGSFVTESSAMFKSLPKGVQFSCEPDVPSKWYTIKGETTKNFDLTGFEVNENLRANFNLTKLVVEAYVKDVLTAKPIPGLVLTAENGKDTVEGYTLKNLGYSQVLLAPAEWKLLLKFDTASSKYYELLSASSNRYEANDKAVESIPLYLSSLLGALINPRIRKKPGFESKDAFSASKQKLSEPTVNVFSIASGHTYEKLMSIMMLSVKKHSKGPVKFWLIENFLSPGFIQQLPQLALEYNFEYEMVAYKWPLWLRQQLELHRTVWGYKMLFLDALFPEDLDKVIFVDADQIARTDLAQLTKVDLEGAPYGFPPMCDSRDGMEGYRFWKQGYWKEVLKDDLQYHISALYVVDLAVFRESHVGDVMREHYQKLSSDPNSLSNLDQDLPNNLQRLVPIFTLPQDWLWCETWCSKELKKSAKMIDLCNDPTSSESKIDRARRLIPEWDDYRKELEALVPGSLGPTHDEL